MMRRHAPTVDEAAALALQVLTFLASDGERLSRFLALTGMGPNDLRSAIGGHEMQAAILEYLLADESLLLTFCAETAHRPETVAPALQALERSGP